VGLRDWRQRRSDRQWHELFQANARSGEQVVVLTSCTYGSDPLDRRMAALTDAALYLCAVPARGAFIGRIAYDDVTAVDNSRVTHLTIDRPQGGPVELRSIDTHEFVTSFRKRTKSARWTEFKSDRSR
jgi:hypothetical protein